MLRWPVFAACRPKVVLEITKEELQREQKTVSQTTYRPSTAKKKRPV